MQETHSAKKDQLQWEKQWGKKSNIFLNQGQSNARGNAILFTNMDFTVTKYADDSNGRIQVMAIKTPEHGKAILLINIYNENNQTEQLALFEKLEQILGTFGDLTDHDIIFGGDFNLIFDRELDSENVSGELKLQSIAALTNIIEKYDLVDIYRVRNPNPEKKKIHL